MRSIFNAPTIWTIQWTTTGYVRIILLSKIMELDKEKILKGIAAYQEQQNEILAAIESRGGKLTEKEFDDTFGDYTEEILANGESVLHMKPNAIKIWPYAPNAFLLGSLVDHTDWAKYLQITQLMCAADILTARKEDDLIVYRKKEGLDKDGT
jgi:hypothetical protein